MDFCEPYDLTVHLNDAFYESIHSKKWLERKDAIQELINVMEKNQVLVPNEPEIQKLIGELTKLLTSDNNINVAATSATALAKIAYGAAEIFKHSAPSIILNCLTRMKDLKPVIQNACIECVDMAYTTTKFANTLEPIKSGLALTAPGSKIQTCEFFTRIMLKIDFPTAKASAAATKEVIDQLCKLALGSDVGCREAAMKSLGALMRAVSPKVATPMLTAVASDKLKMAKVEENYDKFIVEYPFDDGSKKVEAAVQDSSSKQGTSTDQTANDSASEEVDPRTFMTPYDLTKHLDKEFYENIHSKKWLERKNAIQELINVMEKNQVLVPNEPEIQKLIGELTKLLTSDNNINVAATSATALAKIAYGAAEIFKHSAPSVILNCLTRMKDLKPVIQNACIECVDMAYTTTTFATALEPIKSGLALTAPGSKIQTCEFFTRIMLKIDFATTKRSSPAIKEIVDLISKLALGSDVACREAAMKSLGALMRAVSPKVATPMLTAVASDKLKMAKVEENYNKFIEEHPFKEGKLDSSEKAANNTITISSSQTSAKGTPRQPVKAPPRVSSSSQRQPVRVTPAAKPAISNGVPKQPLPVKAVTPRIQPGIARQPAARITPTTKPTISNVAPRQPIPAKVVTSRVQSGIARQPTARVTSARPTISNVVPRQPIPANVVTSRVQSGIARQPVRAVPAKSTLSNGVPKQPVKTVPSRVQSGIARQPVRAMSAKPTLSNGVPKQPVKAVAPRVQSGILRPPAAYSQSTDPIFQQFPSRTQSASQMIPPRSVMPNVVRREDAEQAIRHVQTSNGNSRTYGLVYSNDIQPDDGNSRRSMLRPPSSVVRPTKSIEDLAGQ